MFLSLAQVSQLLLAAVVIGVIYFLVIKPKRLLKFYEQQGCHMEYKFGIGYFQNNIENVKKKGDFFHSWKEFGRGRPTAKAFGGNLAHLAHVVLVDPALIKAFYMRDDKLYKKNRMWSSIWSKLFEHGLLLAEGQEWKRHRRLISGAFHFESLREMTPEIVRVVDRAFEQLKARDPKELESVDIMQEFQAITGELIGILFFGEEFSKFSLKGIPVSQFLADLIARMSKENFSLNVLLFGSKILDLGLTATHRGILQDTKLFREYATAVIKRKFNEIKENPQEAKATRISIIDVMLTQRAEDPKDQLSDNEIIEEFVTFFVAGMDTTGHTVTLASYFLHQNSELKPRLLEEIDEHFKDINNISFETLMKCDVATAFLKEVLRYMHPASAIFDRIAIEDHKLGDLMIKKGTSVNVGYVANNFNPEYHDDVDKFDVDRWLKPSRTKESTSKDPYVYIPFSAGVRNCIGQHFAMIQARAIFCLFIKKFDYHLPSDYKLSMTLRFLYEPLDTIRYRLTPKE